MHTRQGTNQYKKQRFYHQTDGFRFSMKRGTFYSIIAVLAVTLFFSFFSYMSRATEKALAEGSVISAETMPVYHEPTLNPNVTEREQNIAIIKRVWGKDAEVGLAIARCEGGYRTHAVHYNNNNTIDEGQFQINSIHGMPDMQNATANTLYAYSLYQQQGTNPWTASKECWSK